MDVGEALVASEEWLNGIQTTPEPDPNRMVVGFDTRFLSDRFAVEVARVLAANGYKVYLTSADVPTPAVSHAVRQLGAIAGVMITASIVAGTGRNRSGRERISAVQPRSLYSFRKPHTETRARSRRAGEHAAAIVRENLLSEWSDRPELS